MKQIVSFCDKALKETTIKVHHVKSEKKEHKEKKENNHIKWSSNKSLTLSNRKKSLRNKQPHIYTYTNCEYKKNGNRLTQQTKHILN